MKGLPQRLRAAIERLNQRERAIVLLALILGLGMASLQLGMDPRSARLRLAQAHMAELRGQLDGSRVRAADLQGRLAADPNAALRARIAQRRAELSALSEQFALLQRSLVAPADMPALLQTLVGAEGAVRVTALRNLPPQPVVEQAAGSAGPPALYRHGVEITLEGSYADLLAYLQRLEAQPQKLYWVRAALSAEYPRTTLVLTVYTLGLTRDWVSV